MYFKTLTNLVDPSEDPFEVVGYIPSTFLVRELLDNVFGENINGIDAIARILMRIQTMIVIVQRKRRNEYQ